MKKLKYILMTVSVLAIMSLTSCINEEGLSLNKVSMDVNLTRGGATSEQHGDKFEEVMIWAFEKSSDNRVTDVAAGWRRAIFTDATYTSVSVHLELPMCGDAGADYILVAVINPAKFGDVTYNGSALSLGANTTYTELINARFANSTASTPIMNSVTEGKPGEPALMPVSHWTPISVTSADIHKSDGHKVVSMSVFRAVAKTQFLVARTSEFDLKIKSLKLYNQKMPVDGMVLSPLSGAQLQSENIVPSWFGQNTPSVAQTDAAKMYDFQIATDGVAVAKTLAAHTTDVNDYTLAGGCTIAETSDACTYSDNAMEAPANADDGGYYYEITYQIGSGAEQTRYVALPAVARNHDYQVRALINGEGGLNVNYTVADWKDAEWDLDFSPANNTNLLSAPNVTAVANVAPTVKYNANSSDAVPFKGYFRMSGPVEAEWQPVIYGAESDSYTVEVFEVTNPTTVTLAATPSALPIKVTDANKEKFYEIRVTAKDVNRNGLKFKLAISHTSAWHTTDAKLLLINAGSSSTSTYWPESGNNHTYVEILQN